jgi:hypothetical protein
MECFVGVACTRCQDQRGVVVASRRDLGLLQIGDKETAEVTIYTVF